VWRATENKVPRGLEVNWACARAAKLTHTRHSSLALYRAPPQRSSGREWNTDIITGGGATTDRASGIGHRIANNRWLRWKSDATQAAATLLRLCSVGEEKRANYWEWMVSSVEIDPKRDLFFFGSQQCEVCEAELHTRPTNSQFSCLKATTPTYKWRQLLNGSRVPLLN